MLRDGLIVLTFVWSLVVDFAHSPMTGVVALVSLPMVVFPHLGNSNSVSASPAGGVFASQLRCARICSGCGDFCSEDLFWFTSY